MNAFQLAPLGLLLLAISGCTDIQVQDALFGPTLLTQSINCEKADPHNFWNTWESRCVYVSPEQREVATRENEDRAQAETDELNSTQQGRALLRCGMRVPPFGSVYYHLWHACMTDAAW